MSIEEEAAFVCPISRSIMVNPVDTCQAASLSDSLPGPFGTFEKWAILKWYTGGNDTLPVTNQPLCCLDLYRNLAMRQLIHDKLPGKMAALRQDTLDMLQKAEDVLSRMQSVDRPSEAVSKASETQTNMLAEELLIAFVTYERDEDIVRRSVGLLGHLVDLDVTSILSLADGGICKAICDCMRNFVKNHEIVLLLLELLYSVFRSAGCRKSLPIGTVVSLLRKVIQEHEARANILAIISCILWGLAREPHAYMAIVMSHICEESLPLLERHLEHSHYVAAMLCVMEGVTASYHVTRQRLLRANALHILGNILRRYAPEPGRCFGYASSVVRNLMFAAQPRPDLPGPHPQPQPYRPPRGDTLALFYAKESGLVEVMMASLESAARGGHTEQVDAMIAAVSGMPGEMAEEVLQVRGSGSRMLDVLTLALGAGALSRTMAYACFLLRKYYSAGCAPGSQEAAKWALLARQFVVALSSAKPPETPLCTDLYIGGAWAVSACDKETMSDYVSNGLCKSVMQLWQDDRFATDPGVVSSMQRLVSRLQDHEEALQGLVQLGLVEGLWRAYGTDPIGVLRLLGDLASRADAHQSMLRMTLLAKLTQRFYDLSADARLMLAAAPLLYYLHGTPTAPTVSPAPSPVVCALHVLRVTLHMGVWMLYTLVAVDGLQSDFLVHRVATELLGVMDNVGDSQTFSHLIGTLVVLSSATTTRALVRNSRDQICKAAASFDNCPDVKAQLTRLGDTVATPMPMPMTAVVEAEATANTSTNTDTDAMVE